MLDSTRFEVKTESYLTQYRQLDEDLLFFKRTQTYSGVWRNVDVYGQFWVLAMADLPPAGVFYHRLGQRIPIQGPVAVYIPPFSLVELEIEVPELRWEAYVSRHPLTFRDFSKATMLKWDGGQPFESRKSMETFLNSADALEPVDKIEEESLLATEIKSYLDRHLGDSLNIHEVAKQFGLSDSSLSRLFKKSYGLTPVVYRNKMRVFESMSKLLAEPQNVTSVGFEVGFNDLGRFHKQFKKYASARPAQYKAKFDKK